MGMTCYIAHTYVVSDEDSAYYELGFDNEMRPNIVVTESFIDDFAQPEARKKLINDAFDANYTWREGDQYSYYSSEPWENEEPYTMADEVEDLPWEEQQAFDKFFGIVEGMKNIKYVLLATDATKPSDNYGEFWYDALVCDFKKRNLVKIEWRGAKETYWETHFGDNMFDEEKAEEIIDLLERGEINQFDSGDFELNGVLQGQVMEFPISNSSQIPNNNHCIHILPDKEKQNGQTTQINIEKNDSQKSDREEQEEKILSLMTKVDEIDFSGKAFVIEGLYNAQNADGAIVSPDDSNHPIVKRVIEAGGLVRKAVSGKTNYLVINMDTLFPGQGAKCRDALIQIDKGKPIVVISLENLLQILDERGIPKEEGWVDLR